MKVLFVIRPDYLTVPGGDVIQLQKTQAALQDLGVEVRLGQGDGENLTWADIVHVFSAQTPEITLPALRMARQAGKKTVLSTIWWDLSHAQLARKVTNLHLPFHVAWALVRPLAREAVRWLRREQMQDINETLQLADLLLPNSEEEMAWLRKDFGLIPSPYRTVMNAVDISLFRPDGIGQGVICCARQEPTKNQLTLIKAVAELDSVPLTLVGKAGDSEAYAQQVRRAMRRPGFVLIEEHLPQVEMVKLLRQHRVHALPSFRESPGLSSLEAVATGLNAVVAGRPFCPVDTYFGPWLGQYVFTCTPYRVDSVRDAVTQALQAPAALPSPFPEEFTWADVGRQTLEAYRTLL